MPLGQQAGHGEGDDLALALDEARDVVDDGLGIGGESCRLLGGQGGLRTHPDTLGEAPSWIPPVVDAGGPDGVDNGRNPCERRRAKPGTRRPSV